METGITLFDLKIIEVELPPAGTIIKQDKILIYFNEYPSKTSKCRRFTRGNMPSIDILKKNHSFAMYDNVSFLFRCNVIERFPSKKKRQIIRCNLVRVIIDDYNTFIGKKSGLYRGLYSFGDYNIFWKELPEMKG